MTGDASQDPRSYLIARLAEDLVGPSAPDEVLTDRPSDRYLTGILYPRRLEFAANEDEKLANGSAEATEEGASDDEDVPPATLHKPSAAGLSFCISVPVGSAPSVLVRVSGGTYTPRVGDSGNAVARSVDAAGGVPAAGASTAPDGLSNGGPNGPSGVAGAGGQYADDTPRRQRTEWRRAHHEFDVHVALNPDAGPDVPLDGYGLTGYSLYVTQAPIGGGRMITIRLVNGHEWMPGASDGKRPDEMSLFQARIEVRAVDPARIVARPSSDLTDDPDGRTAGLLYRRVREFAVGHTCSASWCDVHGDAVETVATSWLPEQSVRIVSPDGARPLRTAVDECRERTGREPLSAAELAGAGDQLSVLLDAVPAGYEAWIAERQVEADTFEDASLREQAAEHLKACRTALGRMRAGAALIGSDEQVRAAFVLMNQAMHVQRVWTERVRARHEERMMELAPAGLRWYPFQLAFILQNMESLADPDSGDRMVMDLLWFPTGGGKTEAYLGLIAFTALLRRLRRGGESDRGGGVSCIMRYTLRLLTLQQFQRAATLMLACEYVRRGHESPPGTPDLSATAPFSVGLWVGGDATPNKLKDAIPALSNPFASSSPKQLTSCPCCGERLTWEANASETDITVRCRADGCALGKAVPELPVRTVDELIYRDPPTLLFATVDKFAQIARSADTRALFNTGKATPPDLIIQDELHLISGPLGTLTAIYESAVDLICSRDGHPPKVIGSTATIRRADEQITALFHRRAAQFPPPGLDIDDSCFAYVKPDAPTRRYAGVTTAGRSAKFTLQAVYASLLQAAPGVTGLKQRDGYHTLVGYFNALRELGGALVLSQDDVPASMKLVATRRGEPLRQAREVVELTSRVSQQDIRRILDQVELPHDQEGSVDVILATNMISVGVDVSRLALMVVMGQPKGISEYIQATSRVGRDRNAPGLVVTVLNANKARDRAHFESFTGIHQALYRGVEATSVTPFAARARDRALHAAVVAAARHLIDDLAEDPSLQPAGVAAVEEIIARIAARAADIDPEEAAATREDLDRVLELWRQRAPAVETYWNDEKEIRSLLMAAERAAARNRSGLSGTRAWPTLNSMRSVEAGTPFRLVERLRNGQAIQQVEQ